MTTSTYQRICEDHDSPFLKCLARQLEYKNVTLSDYNLTETNFKCFFEAYLGKMEIFNFSRTVVSQGLLKIISKFFSRQNSLKTLNLENCRFDGQMTILFKSLQNHSLSYINLSGIELKVSDMTSFCDFLQTQKNLLNVDLSKTSIDLEKIKILSRCLSYNETINMVNLSWNQICDEGGATIAKIFKTNVGITVLDLSMNGIGLKSCEEFARSLKSAQNLEYLDLSNNHINKKCLNFVLNGLYNNKSVTNINLTGNPLDMECPIMIARMLLKSTESVLTYVEIKNLSVNSNFEEIYDQLQKKRHVHILYERKNFGKLPENKEQQGLLEADPMLILAEYMRQKNLRVLDFFKLANVSYSEGITKENLTTVCNKFNINFSEHSIEMILKIVDENGDENISYQELQAAIDITKKRINELKRQKDNKSKILPKLTEIVRRITNIKKINH